MKSPFSGTTVRRRVAVIAPASAPTDIADLERGIDFLQSAGLEVVTERSDFNPHGYLAGTDDVRIRELNRALLRDDVDLVFCARGGYGAIRLLDQIDYDGARRHPKLLVGYSDITALQLALNARSGLTSISGPMVSVEFAGQKANDQQPFWSLFSSTPPFRVESPDGSGLTSVRHGHAEGKLIGGNLAVLTRLIGTPYLPDLSGAILFLEDVGEAPYRLDGMFAQLRLSGALAKLGGVVLGAFSDASYPPDKPSLSAADVVQHYFGTLPIPVAANLCYGHFPVKNALPIGLTARLEVNGDSASLTLLDPVWPIQTRPILIDQTV